MSSIWAPSVAAELSQGDLLVAGWIGTTAEPPRGLKKTTGRGSSTVWAEQNSLAVDADGKGYFLAKGVEAPVVVLSQNCEIDKHNGRASVVVAPVRALDDVDGKARDIVRNGQRHAFFYLPEVAGRPEAYCDLRATTYLARPVLSALTRVASMTEAGADALARQLIMFFVRIDVDKLGLRE